MFRSGNWAVFVAATEVEGRIERSLGLCKSGGRFSELLRDELRSDD